MLKRVSKFILMILIAITIVGCGANTTTSVKENDNTATPQQVDKESEVITLTIVELFEDHFTATYCTPAPDQYTVYAALDDEFCAGDYVDVYYEVFKEVEENKIEITAIKVEPSDFKLDPNKDYKPVIYLYPTKTMQVSVTLEYAGTLTDTYPIYQNGWKITASPDGSIMDDKGRTYPYLFWEGINEVSYDMNAGFCISGAESKSFLEEKLSYLGLSSKEANDFMEFWLPFLQDNPYNLISFQTKAYTDTAKLVIEPKPDSMLRVFMTYTPLEESTTVVEQKLECFDRKGFSVIEWGGRMVE